MNADATLCRCTDERTCFVCRPDEPLRTIPLDAATQRRHRAYELLHSLGVRGAHLVSVTDEGVTYIGDGGATGYVPWTEAEKEKAS